MRLAGRAGRSGWSVGLVGWAGWCGWPVGLAGRDTGEAAGLAAGTEPAGKAGGLEVELAFGPAFGKSGGLEVGKSG